MHVSDILVLNMPLAIYCLVMQLRQDSATIKACHELLCTCCLGWARGNQAIADVGVIKHARCDQGLFTSMMLATQVNLTLMHACMQILVKSSNQPTAHQPRSKRVRKA